MNNYSLVYPSVPLGQYIPAYLQATDYLNNNKPTGNPDVKTDTNPSLLTQFGDFWNSDAGKGLMGAGGLVGGLMDAFTNYGAYRQNKKNMALQREIGQYNLGRMKSENARIDKQRDDITNSWKNGQVI